MDDIKRKEWQLEVILQTNPAPEPYSTWIRSLSDIRTYDETLQDSDWIGWEEGLFDPDYSGKNAATALHTGMITVYSSYPIKQGTFATPSKMEAQSYSDSGWVDCKTALLTDVAWIDPTQGQYTSPMPDK